jgi:DNA-binding transcriptional ArsR family regulator
MSIHKKFVALDAQRLENVARMFAALAEPTRLRILQMLQQGPLTVTELVSALEMKQANVSKQLGLLHQAGLVARQREGNLVRYRISEPMIFELCGLVCAKLQRDAEAQVKAFA